ncbi:hypothetical protein CDD81_8115 [Ophiocordyceps australis]|uniref:Uncharacterized protein n=1 Tax=Ophiocordyceps australis TaxID=1399860 RepID=A0A2C5Y2F9_9HYPO|nr:hypothetical protein CDD81_8115 [Ophiocordyceps australis]
MSAQASPSAVLGDGGSESRLTGQGPLPTVAHSASSGVDAVQDDDGKPLPPSRRPTALLSRTNMPNETCKDREPGKALSKTNSSTTSANVGLDPLSTQIYLRTNSTSEPSIAQRLRNPARAESPASDNANDASIKAQNAAIDVVRDRRKGPSFLSRLAMRSARRKDGDGADSDSELGDLRTDGSDARAMTSIMGAGGGYIPLYKEPSRYIRVKAHHKKTREFDHLFLAQELVGAKPPTDGGSHGRIPATAVGSKILKPGDAIWAAEFSLDGRYLAVAGKDQTVRVFSVISTPEERRAHQDEENQMGNDQERLSAPVFRSKPTREFEGHTGEVLALSWSKNNFLLSSSMDKSVRLWHMSRKECLCTFRHPDMVTSIAFHPTDDRFFIAGSLDAQLRLWSIPDRTVAFAALVNEFITAVAFSPDGKTAICGVLSGLCMFFATEGLGFQFQIHVRSSRGKNAKGSKITGIRTIAMPSDGENTDAKVLVSSNDSRVRIYSLRTRMLEVKFRGTENQSSQIHARFSDDGRYVISGSEDQRAYIWCTNSPEAEIKDKQPYECFVAHPEVVTTALMAPVTTRQLLSASGDPLYDLCNPPPVMLLSLDERTASQSRLSDTSHADTNPPSIKKKPEESPAYIERSKHMDGNIIITTDRTGKIKVFRQDCAYSKRQQISWETASKLSGRLASVGRSASIATRTSGSSRVHSRRGSLNLGPVAVQLQPASDKVMSWRQDLEGRMSMSGGPAIRSERSMSPMKASRSPPNTSLASLASEARRQPYGSSSVIRSSMPTSPTATSVRTSRTSLKTTKEKEPGPTVPPTPSFSLIGTDASEKTEGSFWNLNRWKEGLQGFRTSAAASSADSMQAKSTSTHARTESEGLGPPAKTTGRRSLAINEFRRQKASLDMDRRKSMEPLSAARQKQGEGETGTGGGSEPSHVPKSPLMMQKRTDSGVAQMSTNSTDDGEVVHSR